jgi:hypothetical protein
MNPLGTRARAADFARLLDVGTPAGGAVALAGRLRSLGTDIAPAPRTEFKAALRTRLMAVAAVQAVNAPAAPVRPRPLEAAVGWTQTRRGQRGIGVAAGAMASVVAVAGIAVAGSQSLPGDPFYGVKRGAEAFELRTTSGEVAKGSKHLEFAAERLKEVRALTLGRDAALGTGGGSDLAAGSAFGGSLTSKVQEALADMDSETRAGSTLLTDAYRASQQAAPLQILSRFADRQAAELTTLLPALPAGARPRAATSLALVNQVAAQTTELLDVGTCTGACAPTATAPALPPGNGGPAAPAPGSSASCGCQPGPAPVRTADPNATAQPAQPTASPQPTAAPSPSPAPSPTASPSSSPGPLPVPTAVPTALPTSLPTLLPSPLPTPLLGPTLSPLTVPALPGLSTASSVPLLP